MATPNGNGARLAQALSGALSSVWYAISIIGALAGLVAYTVHLEARITAIEVENEQLLKRIQSLDVIANQALRLDTPVGKIVNGIVVKLDALNDRQTRVDTAQQQRLEEISRDDKRINDRIDRLVNVIDNLYEHAVRQQQPKQ